jgi:hypothetical protein
VALAATAIVVLARCQQREIGRERERRGEGREGKGENENKKQQRGAPCFPLVLFEHLEIPRAWSYLDSIPKGVLHKKKKKNVKIAK